MHCTGKVHINISSLVKLFCLLYPLYCLFYIILAATSNLARQQNQMFLFLLLSKAELPVYHR